ncbi:MAG: glycosyltransferase family 2 protein [Desulfomonilaceae bacterium]
MPTILKNSLLISVVAPIFNEENNIISLVQRLDQVFSKLNLEWELVLALDPCTDRTEEKILELIDANYPIRMVKFSRRFGKPVSLLAGLRHCLGDATIVIDADLQDPPELIGSMIEKWSEGNLVVIAQRTSRKGENLLYLKFAELFYWILEKFSEVNIPRNTGDFRLLDKRVVEEISLINERHGFLRGLTALVGFKTAVVTFERDARLAGQTQISLMGAIGIALDGIFPFSRAPIRLIMALGLVVFGVGMTSGILWTLYGFLKGFEYNWLLLGNFLFVLTFFGVVISCIGVVGEYVLRCYEETRSRHLYIVDLVVESSRLSRKISQDHVRK